MDRTTEKQNIAEMMRETEAEQLGQSSNPHTDTHTQNNNIQPSPSSPPSSTSVVAGTKRAYQGHTGSRKAFIQSTASLETASHGFEGTMSHRGRPPYREGDEEREDENTRVNGIGVEGVNPPRHSITPYRPFQVTHYDREDEEGTYPANVHFPIGALSHGPNGHDANFLSTIWPNEPTHDTTTTTANSNVNSTMTNPVNPVNTSSTNYINAINAAPLPTPSAAAAAAAGEGSGRGNARGEIVYTSPAGTNFTRSDLERYANGNVRDEEGHNVFFHPSFIEDLPFVWPRAGGLIAEDRSGEGEGDGLGDGPGSGEGNVVQNEAGDQEQRRTESAQ